jgi:iron complex transport system permease protein
MQNQRYLPAVILWITPAAAILAIILSVSFGAKSIPPERIWDAIFHFDPSNVDHQIIRASRLPRVLGSLLIGAFLAVSGALMQGMTRNYLASPSIMGVSDGSVFLVTMYLVFAPTTGSVSLIVVSMIGSALGAAMVFGIARLIPGGLSPVKLAILGTIIGTFLSGVSAAVSSYFQISQGISFWYNTRLNSMDPELIKLSIPFAVIGLGLAFGLSRSITVLSLGDDVSAGLGQRTVLVKMLTILSVTLLTGTAVALAGKIAFIGLIIPHIARFLSGIDYRKIIPVSAVLGALFLAYCDILSRFLNYPYETPIGVVMALFGVPFFLYLIKKKGGAGDA